MVHDGGRSGTDRRRHLSIPGVRPWLGVFPLWRAVHHAGGGGGPDREPRHPPFPPTKAHVPRPGLAAVAPPYSGLARLGSGPGCRRSASQGSDRLILRLIVGCPCSTLTPGSPGQCGALFKNYLSLSDKYCRARLSLSLSTCIIEKIALLLRSSRFVPRLVRSAGWISSFLPAAWG